MMELSRSDSTHGARSLQGSRKLARAVMGRSEAVTTPEMELKGKRVMVLGLGRTGLETARFLEREGADVLVSDCKGERDLQKELRELSGLPIRFLLGEKEAREVEEVDLLVPSPGVSVENPLLQQAAGSGVEIVSEIELAYRFLRAPLVAVTGTNGKSTTTSLIGEMLGESSIQAFVGGNIGEPLIGFVQGSWDWGVVEISSFQLEWVEGFRPRIAVLLNVTEDHLDRYENFASYFETKGRIFAAQGDEDVALLNRDDAGVWSMREGLRARVLSFGWEEVREGIFATGEEIYWREKGVEERFPLSRVKIQGIHNVENLMAAIGVAKSLKVPGEIIQRVMERFPGIEHRLEFVREKDGVRYYNDSKGTNVGAVVKSLASFSAPVILIAGGINKGGSYQSLGKEVQTKVKKLVLFGAAKNTIRTALGRFTETVTVEDLAAAVEEAHGSAAPGDTVLLSPACSSFDMFENYAERGRVFKDLVREL